MERYGKLEEDDMERLIREDGAAIRKSASDDDTLVYGSGGLRVTARTPNQRKLVEAVRNNDMVSPSVLWVPARLTLPHGCASPEGKAGPADHHDASRCGGW